MLYPAEDKLAGNARRLYEHAKAALYLDVADDGSVESETAKMDKDGAAFWLDVAAVGIESLTSYEAAETESRAVCAALSCRAGGGGTKATISIG